MTAAQPEGCFQKTRVGRVGGAVGLVLPTSQTDRQTDRQSKDGNNAIDGDSFAPLASARGTPCSPPIPHIAGSTAGGSRRYTNSVLPSCPIPPPRSRPRLKQMTGPTDPRVHVGQRGIWWTASHRPGWRSSHSANGSFDARGISDVELLQISAGATVQHTTPLRPTPGSNKDPRTLTCRLASGHSDCLSVCCHWSGTWSAALKIAKLADGIADAISAQNHC